MEYMKNIRKRYTPLTNTLVINKCVFASIISDSQNGGAISIYSPTFEKLNVYGSRFVACKIPNGQIYGTIFSGAGIFAFYCKNYIIDKTCFIQCQSDECGATKINSREESFFNESKTDNIFSDKVCNNLNSQFYLCNHTSFFSKSFYLSDTTSKHVYCHFAYMFTTSFEISNLDRCYLEYIYADSLKLSNCTSCSFLDLTGLGPKLSNFISCFANKGCSEDVQIMSEVVDSVPYPINVYFDTADMCHQSFDENLTISKQNFNTSFVESILYSTIYVVDCDFIYIDSIPSNFAAIQITSINYQDSLSNLNTFIDNTRFIECFSFASTGCISIDLPYSNISITRCCASYSYGQDATFAKMFQNYQIFNLSSVSNCYLKQEYIMNKNIFHSKADTHHSNSNFSNSFNIDYAIGVFIYNNVFSYMHYQNLSSDGSLLAYNLIDMKNCNFIDCSVNPNMPTLSTDEPYKFFLYFNFTLHDVSFINCNFNFSEFPKEKSDYCNGSHCQQISLDPSIKFCITKSSKNILTKNQIIGILVGIFVFILIVFDILGVIYYNKNYRIEKRLELDRELLNDYG